MVRGCAHSVSKCVVSAESAVSIGALTGGGSAVSLKVVEVFKVQSVRQGALESSEKSAHWRTKICAQNRGRRSKMFRFWRSESWALHWKPRRKPPRYFLLGTHQQPYEKAAARKIHLSNSTACIGRLEKEIA